MTWILLGALLVTAGCAAAPQKGRSDAAGPAVAGSPPIGDQFAPVDADHPLASVWNDPGYTRRLMESYAPAPDVEPQVSPEEGMMFREEIIPLLRDEGLRERAIQKLEGMIQPHGSALFEFQLGNVYFQDGELTNAVRYFLEATAKFPDFRRAWQNLGFALARDGRYADAIAPLGRAISLGATESKMYGVLGFCYMNEERWVSAEAAYKQAMMLEPENADFKLGIVKCYVQQRNYSAASAMLDELLVQFPDREQIWTLQANVYLQTEQPDLAAVNLEMLRRMGKATAKNLTLLGDIYMTQDATALALPVYLEAVDKQGAEDWAPALRAAGIMVGRGAWKESSALFEKIREVAGEKLSEAEKMQLLKLESKVAMANGRGNDAIRVLEEIVELNPLDGEALLLAGDCYSRAGDTETAAFRYDLASKIDGFEADAFIKQAQLLAQSSKYAEAVELLRKAQKIRPRDNVQQYMEAIERAARRSGRSG